MKAIWSYNVLLYEIWSHLDEWKRIYRPKKLENFLSCCIGNWAGGRSFAHQHGSSNINAWRFSKLWTAVTLAFIGISTWHLQRPFKTGLFTLCKSFVKKGRQFEVLMTLLQTKNSHNSKPIHQRVAKVYVLKGSLHWLSKNIKVIFMGALRVESTKLVATQVFLLQTYLPPHLLKKLLPMRCWALKMEENPIALPNSCFSILSIIQFYCQTPSKEAFLGRLLYDSFPVFCFYIFVV